MTNVAEEMPFVAVVNDNKLANTCSNCFARKPETLLDAIYKHECNFLVTSKYCPPATVRALSRFIMRVKKRDLPVAFNGTNYGDLKNRSDEILQSPEYTNCVKFIYSALKRFMGAENVPSERKVTSFYGKYASNVYTIRDDTHGFDDVGYGFYLGLSVHKHSCRPDCEQLFIGSKAVFRSRLPEVKYKKSLTISYCDVLLPKKYRQSKLSFHFHFDCQCKRCMDEEEDLLERSGKSFCCANGAVLPRDNGELLCCNNCEKPSYFTPQLINDANRQLDIFCDEKRRQEIIDTTTLDNLDTYIQLFDNMERILSPYNLYLFMMAATMQVITYRICPEYTMKFLKAQEKAMERYDPCGFSKVMYAFNECLVEKSIIKEMGLSDERTAKINEAWRKLYTVTKNVCGPKYPFTVKIQDECKNLRETSEITNLFTAVEDIAAGPSGDFVKNL